MKIVSFHLIHPSICIEFLVESKAILFERRKIYLFVHNYVYMISE